MNKKIWLVAGISGMLFGNLSTDAHAAFKIKDVSANTPAFVINSEPKFIYLRDQGFSVSIGTSYDMVNYGNNYYINYNSQWYRSSHYDGPWTLIANKKLPVQIRRYRLDDIRMFRDIEYRNSNYRHVEYERRDERQGRFEEPRRDERNRGLHDQQNRDAENRRVQEQQNRDAENRRAQEQQPKNVQTKGMFGSLNRIAQQKQAQEQQQRDAQQKQAQEQQQRDAQQKKAQEQQQKDAQQKKVQEQQQKDAQQKQAQEQQQRDAQQKKAQEQQPKDPRNKDGKKGDFKSNDATPGGPQNNSWKKN